MDPVTQQWLLYAGLAAAGWAVRHFWPQLFPNVPAPAPTPLPAPPSAQPSWLVALETRLIALEQKLLGK